MDGSDWTFFDFIIRSIMVWFFIIGLFIIIPVCLYFAVKLGKQHGWRKKGIVFGESPLVTIIFSLFATVTTAYFMFYEGIFFKYLQGVSRFFGW